MRTVRIKHSTSSFVKGQRLTVMREENGKVWLKGADLNHQEWKRIVVTGPHSEEDVEECLPEPPKKTLAEKVKEVGP